MRRYVDQSSNACDSYDIPDVRVDTASSRIRRPIWAGDSHPVRFDKPVQVNHVRGTEMIVTVAVIVVRVIEHDVEILYADEDTAEPSVR